MSDKKKIIGVTVGTPISPRKIEEKINPVKTVNGKAPDENGNVEVEAGGIPQYGIYVGANLRGMTVCFEQIGYVSGSGYEVMFKAGDDFEIFAEDDYYQVTIEGVTEGHSTGGFNAFSYTFSDQDYIVSAYDENVLKAMKFEDAKVSRAVGDEEGNNIRDTYATKKEIGDSVKTALTDAKESGEFDGKDGTNGVSVTHSWNGTVLTVTSASGTSSADLKGARGDKGDTGAKGDPYTLTDSDKNTIATAVKNSLTTETWTFTLEDGTTVTKKVVLA